jgi:hypothetical protein
LQWREKAILLSPSTFKNIQVVQIVKPHERTETSAAHGRSPSLLPRIRPLSPESFRDRGSLAGLPLNLWYHPKPWPWHTNIHERSQGWSSWKGVDSTFWLVNVFWWVAFYPQPTNNQGETTLFQNTWVRPPFTGCQRCSMWETWVVLQGVQIKLRCCFSKTPLHKCWSRLLPYLWIWCSQHILTTFHSLAFFVCEFVWQFANLQNLVVTFCDFKSDRP